MTPEARARLRERIANRQAFWAYIPDVATDVAALLDALDAAEAEIVRLNNVTTQMGGDSMPGLKTEKDDVIVVDDPEEQEEEDDEDDDRDDEDEEDDENA